MTKIICCVHYTQYELVRQVCKKVLNWRLEEQDWSEECDLIWADHPLPPEKMMRLKPH